MKTHSEVNFEKRGKLTDHEPCPVTGECRCCCYHCRPPKLLTALCLLLTLLLLPNLASAQYILEYSATTVGQLGIKDLTDKGDFLARPPGQNDLLIKKGIPTAIDCPGAAVNSTTARRLTDNAIVAGSCDLTSDTDLGVGFVRYPGGHYSIVDVPGAVITDVYAVSVNEACGQYYNPVDPNASGFARIHGFCWDGGSYQTIDFPVANSVTAILGITDNRMRIGAYFTYDPISNAASEWNWFVWRTGGQFYPLVRSGASWIYPLDANRDDQVLLTFDCSDQFQGGPSEPTSRCYAIYDVFYGVWLEVSLPGQIDGLPVGSYDVNGFNDKNHQLAGEVTVMVGTRTCPPIPTFPPCIPGSPIFETRGFVATPAAVVLAEQ